MTPEEAQRRQQAANTPYISPQWSAQIDDLSKDPNTKDAGLSGPGFYVTTIYGDGRIRRHIFAGKLGSVDLNNVDPDATIDLGIQSKAEEAFNRAFPPEKPPEVPATANVTHRIVRANPDGTIKTDENGNPLPGADENGNRYPDSIVQKIGPDGKVVGTDVPTAQDQNASELARYKAEHGGLTPGEVQSREAQTRALENKNLSDEKDRALELIKIQTAQRLAGVQEQELATKIDDAKKPTRLPDGTFVAWDKNENGEWIARKVNNPATGPKDLAPAHDSALQNMRLGTVAKASQAYMSELLRRTSLPPNDPQFMTQEQASAAMTSFIAEGDQFLREQQGLLGEQHNVQSMQLTQRGQDLGEVQSRRTWSQTALNDAVKHSEEVNKSLSPADAHLAGPGFLGQLMMSQQFAQRNGGFAPVAPIQLTPLQQGLMQTPAWVPGAMSVAPQPVPGAPDRNMVPYQVAPQQAPPAAQQSLLPAPTFVNDYTAP